MKKELIQYGFGLDYLKSWSIQHALREIFQNYLDYGEYNIITKEEKGTENIIVKISNTYFPTDLEFLRIGNSGKSDDTTTIGQHGEGLKMAFLIFQREGLKIKLRTQAKTFEPTTYDNELGTCFGIEYYKNEETQATFDILFTLPKTYYDTFIKTIITKEDIIFECPTYGRIVSKNKGDIFVGGLFVCHRPNYSRAYDFNPQYITLDRDRAMPSDWDIKWSIRRLLETNKGIRASDIQYDDIEYVDSVQEEEIEKFKPTLVNNVVEFTTTVVKEDGEIEEVIVKQDYIKSTLRNHNFFTATIEKLKSFILKKLGVTEMLENYKKAHPMYGDALKDFDAIINRSKHS